MTSTMIHRELKLEELVPTLEREHVKSETTTPKRLKGTTKLGFLIFGAYAALTSMLGCAGPEKTTPVSSYEHMRPVDLKSEIVGTLKSYSIKEVKAKGDYSGFTDKLLPPTSFKDVLEKQGVIPTENRYCYVATVEVDGKDIRVYKSGSLDSIIGIFKGLESGDKVKVGFYKPQDISTKEVLVPFSSMGKY